ncbi:MAG: (d)CMP kinase [Candidatus Mycalebacterium zealandia]|nr:MAG: (d)CMP kinase [Candidatus Mycalebacterium zealandia]
MSGRGRIVITIDGPGASGKGTVARIVAKKLGIRYMDTGSIYRTFALLAREKGVKPGESEKISRLLKNCEILPVCSEDSSYTVTLGGRNVSADIRTPEISENASKFSQVKEVREVLGLIQRAHGENTSIVAEGRDMGTRVFKDADYKFFLTAEEGERARRRAAELKQEGAGATLEQTAAELSSRDRRDSRRKHSPLKPADDAVIIDTTHLGVDEVVEKILNLVEGWKSF